MVGIQNITYILFFSFFPKDIEHYNKLEDPTDEENDMLDLAFGLTETLFSLLYFFNILGIIDSVSQY